ncbi:hydrogenase nickel incorporation protein HypB [Mycolicibacterium arseniciresistens]|uniref:Hydrogenase nickel incorporation protein HypB n=1 Tax=Mycolicibacterium arseniciresistens TaxID=3062257 RepID=A0ABT8UFR6_9MYCO|nr:hydrogenase nickel incorporation protein HypB [Mycolicibacterium arseniciresistens]MDO3636617.1 hydrogenase nickel incorporation protein HypB [Mycolicibacterium arseniciresistens]
MCATCGCGDDGAVITPAGQAPAHHHHTHEGHTHDVTHSDHDHTHDQADHTHVHTETVSLEQKVLAKNDLVAAENRRWLAEHDILAFNLTSSPGAGKTTLLERTIRDLGRDRPIAVIEGDQETLLDADRIRRAGARAVQVNTGAGCHLDAEMVRRALEALHPDRGTLLFIENVGNLVCPAMFDLGEHSKVLVISVTEGADKPLKYPHMFAAAGVVIVNKIDLLPYVDFDVDVCAGHARSINPDLDILALSATTGDGTADWYAWIADLANQPKSDMSRELVDKTMSAGVDQKISAAQVGRRSTPAV